MLEPFLVGIFNGNGIKLLSIREGLRIFGYPDSYNLEFSNNQKDLEVAYDILGNRAITPLIKKIAIKITPKWLKK
jgi:DNA (cytosine-5)-methyltransferase 1